jgi:hypothetical protein
MVDLTFTLYDPLSVRDVMSRVFEAGFAMLDGGFSYGKYDDEWGLEDIIIVPIDTYDEIIDMAQAAVDSGRRFTFMGIWWGDHDASIDVTFESPTVVSFTPCRGTPPLKGCPGFTDASFYLERLLPPFRNHIYKAVFEDCTT